MLRFWHRRMRDESGVIAVVVAVLGLVLFGFAAVAVDLGNAFARKRDLQAQADFAALAGGALLPGNDAGVYAAVADYLNKNQPQDDAGNACTASKTCVTAAELQDGNVANGEVYLQEDSVRVVAPRANVKFGMGNALGFSDTDVSADATVQIFTPGNGPMPAYAVSSCSWGTQILTDPANGQGAGAPTATGLAFPDDKSPANLVDIETPASPFTPTAAGTPGPTFAVVGDTFVITTGAYKDSWVTRIGWFKEDGSAPIVQAVQADRTATRVSTAQIPAAVASTEGLYWVRAFVQKNDVPDPSSAPGEWSPMDEALPFRVGNILLQCNTGSNDGNFGTIQLPRNNPSQPSLWLPSNIAALLDPPLDLKAWPTGPAICRPPGGPTAVGAIISELPAPPGLVPNTNCVDTDTGLPANDATAGMITGVKSGSTVLYPGKLDKDTAPGCSPTGGSSRWDTGINRNPGSGTYTINDDILTCFFDDTALAEIQTLYGKTVTVGDVSQPNYPWPGKPVFSDKIFESPRFFWVPVFRDDASSGGSNYYSIIDFRPAFVTGQQGAATKASPNVDMPDNNADKTRNGLRIKSGSVIAMKVVFLNYASFPNAADGTPVTGYLGVGPTVVRLVD